MTYDEAMQFIKESEKLGNVLGLQSISELLNRLDNPQEGLNIIHVAGTNGKGSTISFISGILAAAGYRVGIYISPVVFYYQEKLQIISYNESLNNEYISKDDICWTLEAIKIVCDGMLEEGLAHPTAFEIETAMAFLYMRKEQVDFLILETGMGGRLDATNVISHPLCSVLTSVSLDHMHYLGSTLDQIAYEKAGIMKPNSCVITSNQTAEVIDVFSNKANELGIPMTVADVSRASEIKFYDSYTSFDYQSDNILENYKIRMLGKYQPENAILAIESARKIRTMGYAISNEAIRKGLWLAKWSGRFERISKEPDIYIDGAHNVNAALSLRDSIEIYFTNRRLIFMIGVLADKDYHSMLSILAPMADTIIALAPNNSRALPSDRLAAEARLYCNRVFDEKDIRHAIERAYMEAGTEDVIFAFGSLSFLGSLAADLKERKDERND